MNSQAIIERMVKKPTNLTEERNTYISRKTGIEKKKVDEVLKAQEDYIIQCLLKTGKAKLLGVGIYILKDNGKIRVKCPQRLESKLAEIKEKGEIDIKEEKIDISVKEINYM